MLQYLDTIIAFVVILLGVSLLITILNQMISTLLGYRGTNLLWGIETLLKTIEPSLSAKAEEVASNLLKKPIISDSLFSKFVKDVPILGWFTKRWKLATAITPQELVSGLNNVAQAMATTDDGKPTANLINQVLSQTNPVAERNAKMVLDTLQRVSPDTTKQLDKLVQELGTKIQGSVGKIEASFDTVMKRTSQRFTLQTRIWTMIFAVLIAFGSHLDSFNIIQKLWENPPLRAQLIDNRETILKEASVVLSVQQGITQGAGPGVPPQILKNAMNNLIKTKVEKQEANRLNPPEFKNLDGAMEWLKNLKGDQKELADEYRNLVIVELGGEAEKIKKELKESGFQLELVKWDEIKKEFEELSFCGWLKRLLGILATAGLLSLGAPFWFNVLKSLSNLRPIVANAAGKTGTEPTQS